MWNFEKMRKLMDNLTKEKRKALWKLRRMEITILLADKEGNCLDDKREEDGDHDITSRQGRQLSG